MKAKYNGTCKVTGLPIIAKVTEIINVNGVWQVAHAQPVQQAQAKPIQQSKTENDEMNNKMAQIEADRKAEKEAYRKEREARMAKAEEEYANMALEEQLDRDMQVFESGYASQTLTKKLLDNGRIRLAKSGHGYVSISWNQNDTPKSLL